MILLVRSISVAWDFRNGGREVASATRSGSTETIASIFVVTQRGMLGSLNKSVITSRWDTDERSICQPMIGSTPNEASEEV